MAGDQEITKESLDQKQEKKPEEAKSVEKENVFEKELDAKFKDNKLLVQAIL